MEGAQQTSYKSQDLKTADPFIFEMVAKEKERQYEGIELIASENFTSKSVMEAMGTVLTNTHDSYDNNAEVEELCQQRALKAFGLDPKEWGVSVRPISGTPANCIAYCSIIKPGAKLMGLALSNGGHLTHGHQTETKKVSASSHLFQSKPYFVKEETGVIDMDALAAAALEFKPDLIISGASGYPRDFDHKRFREIADSVGALLLHDMAHTSGLIASKALTSPFEHCDVVTTTSHKSLRGPRHGLIFYRIKYEAAVKANAEFKMAGGATFNKFASLAIQLEEVATPEFKKYAEQIVRNTKAMEKALKDKGEVFITGGSDNHLLMWDVRPHGLTGSKLEKIYDKIHITTNKNAVVGDKSAANPGGIRLGTPAMTTRGMNEPEMEKIAHFLLKGVEMAIRIQEKTGKALKDFVPALDEDEEIKTVAEEVKAFAKKFSIPGV